MLTKLKLGAEAVASTGWAIFKALFLIVTIVGGLGYLIWLFYAGAIKPVLHPNPTTTQNAKNIENNEYYPDKTDFCLLKLWGFEIISHHSYPDKPAIKETNTEDSIPTSIKSIGKK
jgi:hypothetical protein